MNREEFASTLPGKTQAEKAKVIGLNQPALSRWMRRPIDGKREAILLRGWGLLDEGQRKKAIIAASLSSTPPSNP